MTEQGPLYDQDEPPEDVASLYSWANLHGAKYRDFSAARAQTREKSRLRALQAAEEEKAHALQAAGQQPGQDQNQPELQHEIEIRRAAELARVQEEARLKDIAAQEAANIAIQQAAQQAAQKAARLAAEHAAQQAAVQAGQQAAAQAAQAAQQAELQVARQAADAALRHAAEHAAAQQAARHAAEQAAAEEAARQLAAQRAAHEAELHATRLAAEQAAQQLAAQRAAQQTPVSHDAAQRAAELQAARHAAEQAAQQLAAYRAAQQAAEQAWKPAFPEWIPPAPEQAPAQAYAAPHIPLRTEPPAYAPAQAAASVPHQPAVPRDESFARARAPWNAPGQAEAPGRPAWLTPERIEPAPQPPLPQAPGDTLQGSRDRLTSRWYALRGVFEATGSHTEAAPVPAPARAPVVAIFSLAGGVGKTSLVATLGRALSARGERVLLVETAPYGLLPFFFGASDQRPGLLRTFSPPGNSGDSPIQMVTIEPEGLGPESSAQDPLTGEITTYSRGVSRVIVDLATASGATTRRILRLAPLVVVPLVPDMNSVVSFSSIDSFFQHNSAPGAKPSLPYYVLNQFDPSQPLHLDIREVLREQLGDRLLPFVLRHAPAVSEALAEGMTVMDYAPNSVVAEDFLGLAGWVKSQSAPASSTYRGVRWSER